MRRVTYHGSSGTYLPVKEKNADALRDTVDQIVGPGHRVSDVWVWDVRDLTGNGP